MKQTLLGMFCILFFASCHQWRSTTQHHTYDANIRTPIPLSVNGFSIQKVEDGVTIKDSLGNWYLPYHSWTITDNGHGMIVYSDGESSGWFNEVNVHERLLMYYEASHGFICIEGIHDQILVIKGTEGYGLVDFSMRSTKPRTFGRTGKDKIEEQGIILVEPEFNQYSVHKDAVIFTDPESGKKRKYAL